MARTAKQVLIEQQQQADRDRKPAQQQQLPATVKATLPAPPDHRSEQQRFLDEVSPTGVVGRLIRFNGKVGRFHYADDDSDVDPGEAFTVLADQTLTSWIRFHDGEPPERVGSALLYAPGYVKVERAELGDSNPNKWELDKFGGRSDPWKLEMMLVLQRPATQELLTFTTLTVTGRNAVGGLLKHYDRLRVGSPGACPVVNLRPGSYTGERGPQPIPLFVVVGVSQPYAATIPDTSLKGDLNDEIPRFDSRR